MCRRDCWERELRETDAELQAYAIGAAREIVLREGAALALSARDLDEAAIEADSTLLAAAIAKSIIEAVEVATRS